MRADELIRATDNTKIYLDMDGVICDWDNAFHKISDLNIDDKSPENQAKIWAVINVQPENYWSNIEWTADGKELWNYLKPYNVKICSKPARGEGCRIGKNAWCEKHLGSQVPVILTADKEKWATPTSILIDDRPNNISKWIAAGGIGILHKNTKDTIKQIENILERNG